MSIPTLAVIEFKDIYRKKYGVELSDEEAVYKANKFFSLYKAIFQDCATERSGKNETTRHPETN
jgi:hypothetical protein